MKIKKILGILLSLTIIITGLLSSHVVLAEDFNTSAIKVVNAPTGYVIVPGETLHIKLPVVAEGNTLLNAYVDILGDPDNMMSATVPYLTRDNYSDEVDMILPYGKTYVEFDVTAKASAKIGNYKIMLYFKGYNANLDYIDDESLSVALNMKVREEKQPAQLNIENVDYKDVMIGSTGEIILTLENDGQIDIKDASVVVDFKDTKIIPNYTTTKIKVGDIQARQQKKISIPVKVLTDETEGLKNIAFNFTYKDSVGVEKKDTVDVYVNLKQNEKKPVLEVIETSFIGDLNPGNDVTLVVKAHNKGGERAREIKIAIDPASIDSQASFVKNYYNTSISTGSIKADGTGEVKLPLTISKQATAGIKDLSFIITYEDEHGMEYKLNTTVYPEVKAAEGTQDGKPNLIISNVKQSSSAPKAGENLTISFVAENKSDIDIRQLKIGVGNYSNTTFIPVDLEPYQYISDIKGGDKVTIKVPVTLSETIAKGLNTLEIHYSYVDADGNSSTDNTLSIPVLNVQNDVGSSLSKPKLIISNYTVDPLELKAGSNFTFTFDMTNTNATVSANNITIKVSQSEGIFTPTQGGNSFYVASIKPNETITRSLDLKVKSDASTKLYPITLEIEYEYDGAEPNPTTGEIGEKTTENLNIQVIENARPVVDYINIYSMDGNIVVNSPATLSFEFYNMGKSRLNNVIATVEGDFTKADGNMNFVGNVESGYSEYIEFDVIPSVEGLAKGVLKITFEDSNGDEVAFTKEFETSVVGEMGFDEGMYEDPGMIDAMNPDVSQTKKAILPTWLFLVILPVTFLVGLFVTRTIIIRVYKKKLIKLDQD